MRTLLTVLVLLGLIGLFLTKPSEADFREALRAEGEAMQIDDFNDAVTKGAIALGVYDFACEDYVFVLICTAELPDRESRYLGAARRYIPMQSAQPE